MKKLSFLVAALFPLLVLGQTEPDQQPAERSQAEFQALTDRYQTLQEEGAKSGAPTRYTRISDLWEKVALDLKNHFNNRDQYLENQDFWQNGVAQRFQFLRTVGAEREEALQALHRQGLSVFSVDEHTLRRIGVEIRIIPYKLFSYFYERAHWVKQQFSGGFTGVLRVLLQLLFILLLGAVPFVFLRIAKVFDARLEKQKQVSFYLSFRSQWHRSLTKVLNLLTEYIPWLFTYAAILVVNFLLRSSEFSELTNLTVYLKYFVYYKVFQISLEIILRDFAGALTVTSDSDKQKKIRSTSSFLGLFLLTIYSLKTAFNSILGESVLFSLIAPFFGWIVLFLVFYVSSRWEKEIEYYLRKTNIVALQLVARQMEKRYSLFLSLPGLILVAFHFSLQRLISWGQQFEIMKAVYAKILRVKYESTKTNAGSLERVDDQYIEAFFNAPCASAERDLQNTDFFESIHHQVELWHRGESTEQTVAVYGEKGSGKTTALKNLVSVFQSKGFETSLIKLSSKVFTEKSMETVFEDIFSCGDDEKRVVLIDDVHNMFISTIGGFEVYKKFLERIENKKNVFWIASYNSQAWQFLASVLGKNQYFRLELIMPRLSVEQVKEFILACHASIGREVVYDEIFRSSQRLDEAVASAENRYFYLIWEKSRGNPGIAKSLWLRSLRELNGGRLKVCLPQENPISELSALHQETHFVYTSLFRHENLTVSEAARATHLPRAVVKQAMLRGLEEGFLTEDQGRYQIHIDWFDDVKKFLKGKNLIYEL